MSESVATGCLQCQKPLQQLPTGRPRVYCCTGCKTLSRYERDRLQARLAGLESGLAKLRLLGATAPEYLQGLQTEIDGMKARLALLAGAEEPVSGGS